MGTRTFIGTSALALAIVSNAQANMLLNGSMATTAAPIEGLNRVLASPTEQTLTNWTVTNGTVDIVYKDRWAAADGDWSVDMVGTTGSGTIRQDVDTEIGARYKVSFQLSANFECPAEWDETILDKYLELSILGAGGLQIENVSYTVSPGGRTKTAMGYALKEFEFIADSTSTGIVFSAIPPVSELLGGHLASAMRTGAVIDDVQMILIGGNPPPVPEPASLAVLGLGGLLLLRRGSRRS